jgi:hypothetical protein
VSSNNGRLTSFVTLKNSQMIRKLGNVGKLSEITFYTLEPFVEPREVRFINGKTKDSGADTF